MKHSVAPALFAAALAPAFAQQPVHHPISQPVGFVAIGDNNQGQQWCCQPTATSLLGGSMVTNRSSLLDNGNPVQLLRTQNGLVPRLIVAEEALPSGDYQYYGLTVGGQWVPAPWTMPQPASNYDFGEQLFLLDSGIGMSFLWNSWRGSWLLFPNMAGSTPVTIYKQRLCIVVDDGTQLQGYSAFASLPVSVPVPNGASYVAGVGSALHSQAAFLTGNDEYHVFSPHANRWTRVHVPGGAQQVGRIEYDESLVMFQVGNEAIFVSAYTGGIARHTFTDLNRIITGNTTPPAPTYTLEDNVGIFQDNVTGEGLIYRPIDDTVIPFNGRTTNHTRKVNNEFAGFALSNRTYEFVSGARRGGAVASFSIPSGFSRVTDKLDDAVCVVVSTEPAAYGYSSLTNQWYRTPIQGAVRSSDVDGQDFVGIVPTSTHIYGFSPRRGSWGVIPVSSATVPILKEDGTLAIVDGGTAYVWGTESDQWTAIPADPNPIARGVQDDYYYEVANDPNGPGTRVRFYSRITDQWVEHVFGYRLLDPVNEIVHSDQCMLIRTPAAIVAFSAIGDITSQYSWPMDNYPYHAVAGAPPARFVATGPANGLYYLAFGYGRGPGVVVPPAQGLLLLPQSPAPVVVAVGAYDSRGTAAFQIPIPGNLQPIDFHLQNVGLDLVGPTVVLGRSLFPFQLH